MRYAKQRLDRENRSATTAKRQNIERQQSDRSAGFRDPINVTVGAAAAAKPWGQGIAAEAAPTVIPIAPLSNR
jgi:hypothetical protein